VSEASAMPALESRLVRRLLTSLMVAALSGTALGAQQRASTPALRLISAGAVLPVIVDVTEVLILHVQFGLATPSRARHRAWPSDGSRTTRAASGAAGGGLRSV
jgi:hypothetical protein